MDSRLQINTSCFLVLSFLFSTQSFADNSIFDGLYLKAEVGASFSEDAGNLSVVDNLGTFGSFNDEDLGTAGTYGFGVGKKITDNLSVELAISYKDGYEADSITQLPVAIANTTKFAYDISAWTFFVNALYGINILDYKVGQTTLKPYISGGIGAALVDVENGVFDFIPVATRTFFSGNTRTNFAWNIGFGISMDISENLTIGPAYRYIDLGEAENGKRSCNTLTGICVTALGASHADISAHEFLINLNYHF